ncbi:hypothetical protein DRP05_13900 [Archaeoglobales archaeon]|nr:MAG: hypothetical protein DRP05_13900 [Archaeoglobales archaeon]
MLRAFNNGSWYIPKTKTWLDVYSKWIRILKFISSILNGSVSCHHPRLFVKYGLREKSVWTCADVEMALSAYSAKKLSSFGGKPEP